MKLFGLFVAFVAAEDQWEISFDNEVDFNTADEGYKAFQNMNDQITAEDAGMEFGIHERGKVGTSNASIEKMQMRKYETIKKMTLYLHEEDEREWGRYCPYGCHCAVNGPTDLMAGAGQPVDEIDSACKRHKECIQCALADFDQSVCPWWKPYKMTAMVDDITGEKHLVCNDKPGYCKRSLCECDAQFARDLYAQRKNYNRDNHHRYGTIDTDQACKANSYRGGGNGGNGGGKNLSGTNQCCGSYPKRFPFNTGKAMCCDGKISSIGSC